MSENVLYLRESQSFLFCQKFSLMNEAHPALQRQSASVHFMDSNVDFIQKHLTVAPKV